MEVEPNWQTSLSEWFREYRIEAFGAVLRYGPHRLLFAALLSTDDVGPEGWKMTSPDKAYRLGVGFKKSEESKRARAVGSVSVRRGLRNADARESVVVSIAPYASVEDAQTRLPSVGDRMVYRHKRNHVHREQTALGHLDVPGADDAIALEHRCITEDVPLYNQVVSGTVNRYLFQILLGGVGAMPGWEFISELASRQATKIVDVLLSGPSQ